MTKKKTFIIGLLISLSAGLFAQGNQPASSIRGVITDVRLTDLITQLKNNTAFKRIELVEIEQILNHLIATDILENIQHEIIIGIEGEKIVNSRDFYSVFKTEENFKVVNAGNTIGEIPFSPQIVEDENILLAAKIWKIKFVDQKAKKIEVIPAKDGKKPVFFGNGAVIHPRIREKILEILYSNIEYDFLDQLGRDEVERLRKDFCVFKILNTQTERPLLTRDKHLQLFTFAGTRINRTLQLLFNISEIKNTLDDSSSSFDIEVSKEELLLKFILLTQAISEIDIHIKNLLTANPTLLNFSKWGVYLSDFFKVQLLKNMYFDVEQTKLFLQTIKLKRNGDT